MKPIAAIVETNVEQLAAEVREAFSALREAEIQVEKADKRAGDARKAAELRRHELGRALVAARKAWPARGPKAKGWGEFLAKEGIEQSTAWRYMQLVGGVFEPDQRDEISCSTGAVHEISGSDPKMDGSVHLADRETPAAPRRVRIGFDLRLGDWRVELAAIGKVDVIITDPPYSERVHKSTPTRADGVDAEGLSPNYPPWAESDVQAFVEHWSQRCRGWMLMLCDDELIPAYRRAYERNGRVSFAPVPCVIQGMSVRTRGDGPSSWAVYAMVARPQSGEFAKWGTLPGAYVGGRENGSENGRGKPIWLSDAFVRDYSRAGDLVCDPLAGYGGTLTSALGQGRRTIGAELDAEAHKKAYERSIAGVDEEESTAA